MAEIYIVHTDDGIIAKEKGNRTWNSYPTYFITSTLLSSASNVCIFVLYRDELIILDDKCYNFSANIFDTHRTHDEQLFYMSHYLRVKPHLCYVHIIKLFDSSFKLRCSACDLPYCSPV